MKNQSVIIGLSPMFNTLLNANSLVQGKNDAFLYEQVKENYPHAFACTEKIKSYVESAYDFAMSRDEQVYLTIHIQRLETSQ